MLLGFRMESLVITDEHTLGVGEIPLIISSLSYR